MNDRQIELFGKGEARWIAIPGLFQNHEKQAAYMDARGYFSTVIQRGDVDPKCLGLIALFFYDFASFCAQQLGSSGEANKQFQVGLKLANAALVKDPHEFYSRLFLFCNAVDNLPAKPDTLKTLTGGGGWGKKLFDTGFNLGAYNTAKGNLIKAVEAATEAFLDKIKPENGNSVEECIDMIRRLVAVMDAVVGHDVGFSNVYKALLFAEDEVGKLGTFAQTDAELDALVDQFNSAMELVRGRANALSL